MAVYLKMMLSDEYIDEKNLINRDTVKREI